jgi:Type I phosphodiesterase / nucleotide pyrophosphatase
MKNGVLVLYLLLSTSFIHRPQKMQEIVSTSSASENLFIIITDGFRWQEIFSGADSVLINDESFTPDTTTLKAMYWASDPSDRRKKLMPFLWNVIARKGQLFGNRDLNNKVNVSNVYSLSYPGYNELFTGTTDISISGNSKKYNKNINVLEYLGSKDRFEGKIAVFSSWNVFPFILNKNRNGLMMNSGYEQIKDDTLNPTLNMINSVQEKVIGNKTDTRYDMLTYTTAKEYIKNNKPRIVVIGLGETDDFAHQKRYDLYLQQANQVDKMIGELWNIVQTTPGYKNNTSFIITTDHGRGNNSKHWSGHGFFITGSSQTWLAMMGPRIDPLGERKEKEQFYTKEFAATIAKLTGEEFSPAIANAYASKK